MRVVLPLAAVVALLIVSGSGCGSFVGSSSDGGSEGGSSDGPVGDGAANDAAVADGGSDGAIACGTLGGKYDKTCGTVSDCTTVARGCYCGAQPIIGVAKSSAAAAQACETTAGNNCALGCPNFPGRVAEDGKNDVDGGTIEVLCESNACKTVLR